MKRTLSLLSVLALVLAFSGNAFAQQASQAVPAVANVQQALSLNLTGTNIDFGTIQQGVTASIDPNGSNSNVGNTASSPEIEVSAANDASLIISWNTNVALEETGGEQLAMTPSIAGHQATQGSGNATSATDLTTSGGEEVTAASDGYYYIYLGGSVSPTASQTTGDYSTSTGSGVPLTIEVNYN